MMTLDELIQRLHQIRNGPGRVSPDERGLMPVCVYVTGCMSSHVAVDIRGVAFGVDWQSKKVMLSPTEPLERHYTPEQKAQLHAESERMLAKLKAARKQ